MPDHGLCAFLPDCLPTENVAKPTEELKKFTLSGEEGSEEICKLARGVRLKNLSPPASLKGTESLTRCSLSRV